MSGGNGLGTLHLKLPATSANLGPGFDALGLAMSFYLTIEAWVGEEFGIAAMGRDAAVCGNVPRSLILETYRSVLAEAGKAGPALRLKLHNEIPLGMGCGSSAAALLAGVLLANHFGELGWTGYQAMEEAARREGHPDNVAACWLGGMTVSSAVEENGRRHVKTASCGEYLEWKLMIVVPAVSLATEKARALLPKAYSRADAVANVQNAALLVAAFALGRGDLLRTAVQDRLHQPYRAAACPLLPGLTGLADDPALEGAVLGVALSGAGPSVLVIHQGEAEGVRAAIERAVLREKIEVIEATISKGTASWVT
jgi:homoserine kinase